MPYYRNYAKFHNVKVKTQEGTFDSRSEYYRWIELKLLEKNGNIHDLRRQVTYTLIPSQKGEDGKVIERAVTYIADFVYEEDGKIIVEDVKGVRTPEYTIKRKLMLYTRGIQIREIEYGKVKGIKTCSSNRKRTKKNNKQNNK